MPHIPGCWCNSNGYIGCIVVSPNGNKIIAGRQSGGALTFGLGIGLEKEDIQSMERHPYLTSINPQFGEVGEVGKIIRHALKLYSKAMYLNNETMKFITSMALFEYLGAGGNYKPFKKIRAKLQAHLAENKEDYDSLTETFMMLTSKIVDDKNIGYRTKIIHEGALLEDILPVENDRRRLFGKLSGYIFDIITQMYNYTSLSFDELQEIRKQLLKDIGILT